MRPDILPERRSDHFFNQELRRAIDDQQLRLREESRAHLLTLLALTNLRAPDRHPDPLAKRFLLAEQVPPRERAAMLRSVGDEALLLAGFWWQSHGRSQVDVDYYRDIGSAAYRELPESRFRELARKFPKAANVLTAVSAACLARESETSLLRIYEVWQKTRNPVLARALQRHDIFPVPFRARPC